MTGPESQIVLPHGRFVHHSQSPHHASQNTHTANDNNNRLLSLAIIQNNFPQSRTQRIGFVLVCWGNNDAKVINHSHTAEVGGERVTNAAAVSQPVRLLPSTGIAVSLIC